MGFRPKKVIGWGTKAAISECNMEIVEKIWDQTYDQQSDFTYPDYYQFLTDHGYEERVEPWTLDRNMLNFVHVVPDKYDSDNIEHLYVTFMPMLTTPVDLAHFREEFHENDTPFVYAEIEHLHPESLQHLETFSYTFKQSVFPSQYSVLHKPTVETLANLHFVDPEDRMDVLRALKLAEEGTPLDEEHVLAQLVGYSTLREVQQNYQLAPPFDEFMFAQFLQIFQTESVAYRMTPQVVYYWT